MHASLALHLKPRGHFRRACSALIKIPTADDMSGSCQNAVLIPVLRPSNVDNQETTNTKFFSVLGGTVLPHLALEQVFVLDPASLGVFKRAPLFTVFQKESGCISPAGLHNFYPGSGAASLKSIFLFLLLAFGGLLSLLAPSGCSGNTEYIYCTLFASSDFINQVSLQIRLDKNFLTRRFCHADVTLETYGRLASAYD